MSVADHSELARFGLTNQVLKRQIYAYCIAQDFWLGDLG
jgi:hypothetical protein